MNAEQHPGQKERLPADDVRIVMVGEDVQRSLLVAHALARRNGFVVVDMWEAMRTVAWASYRLGMLDVIIDNHENVITPLRDTANQALFLDVLAGKTQTGDMPIVRFDSSHIINDQISLKYGSGAPPDLIHDKKNRMLAQIAEEIEKIPELSVPIYELWRHMFDDFSQGIIMVLRASNLALTSRAHLSVSLRDIKAADETGVDGVLTTYDDPRELHIAFHSQGSSEHDDAQSVVYIIHRHVHHMYDITT